MFVEMTWGSWVYEGVAVWGNVVVVGRGGAVLDRERERVKPEKWLIFVRESSES